MTTQELHNAFVTFIDAGDEEGARAFLIEHLNEFPEEMKKEIAFSFFVEAINHDANITDLKKNALAMMKEFDTTEALLAEATEAASVREELEK